MRDDHQRLLDILEAIEDIERYVNNIVWKAVERDLPILKPQIEAMLKELGQGR